MIRAAILSFSALCGLLGHADTLTITTAVDLARAVYEDRGIGRSFDLSATLTEISKHGDLKVADATGGMFATIKDPTLATQPLSVGDRVRLHGEISLGPNTRLPFAKCTAVDVVGHGEAPGPIPATGPEVLKGDFDCQLIRIRGIVQSSFSDEIDPVFSFLVINAQGALIPIPFLPSPRFNVPPDGAEIEVVGFCDPTAQGQRRKCGRSISLSSSIHPAIRILTLPDNPFAAPPLRISQRIQPQEISTLGQHRISGTVIAICGGNRIIFRSDNAIVHNANLTSQQLPRVGERVTVVGLPRSDLYRVNFHQAVWRSEGGSVAPPEQTITTNLSALVRDDKRRMRFDADFHGRTIRVTGIISKLSDNGFWFESDGELVRVDTSGCQPEMPPLKQGSLVDLCGVCVMDVDPWTADNPFPRIRSLTLVIRAPSEIHILKTPSWWTPPRLLASILTLVGLIIAILIWNILLRRIAERRGRELSDERLSHLESGLRYQERTRLAVELHDSIVQNLTGAAMEISAAGRFAKEDEALMHHHLDIAAKTVNSTREDLRNCIWDLRSHALEEQDLNAAIRQSLEPHLGNTRLTMRFDIPRQTVSDTSLHAFIRIIRELTVNAIRHGHASSIWVAGCLEGNRLMFSVKDNGCGFDPDRCPGMENGHFGLEGIRERVKGFGGSFLLERLPDTGMKATVTINVENIS